MHRLSRGAACQKYFHWATSYPKRPARLALGTQKTFSTSRYLLKDGRDGDQPVTIRWYEQLFPDSLERKTIEPEEIWDDGVVRELKTRISQLEEELQELQTEKSFDQILPEDQERVREALEKRIPLGDLLKNNVGAYPPSLVHHQDDLVIKLHLPTHQAIYLRNLNNSLRDAASNLQSSIARKELWRWYTRCKQSLPPFRSLIPNASWDVLWKSQYQAAKMDKDRAVHLRLLLEDMLEGRRELTSSQRLIFIDSLRQDGLHEEAIKKWESEEVHLRADRDTCWEFEELGVQLYASGGYPQKAQDLAQGVLTREGSKKARLLIPVITSWAQQGDISSLKTAWALYIRLKEHLGSNINTDDYDRITMCFLDTQRAELALAVFKDMMLIGEASGYESTELYRTSLGLVNNLQSQSADSAALNKVSLTALTILPRKFQNKFFYASWMKKLLGMGEMDAAALVVELMYQRGIKPDAKHLNGIIGAWLRAGNVKSKAKAVQMGWAMIRERIDFVRRRRDTTGMDQDYTTMPALPESQIHIPPHLQRTVPPATIETFSLLLLYYEQCSMVSNIGHLRNYMSVAEISPNSYFMNHLLYAELRHGNYQTSWKVYENMSKTVRPDLETFACLWDCQKAHLDRAKTYRPDGFPKPRHVFFDMMAVVTKMSKRERDAAQDAFSGELYNQIIRCMCLAKDIEGIIVALYALRHYFYLLPDENVARMVTLQIARIGETNKPKTTTTTTTTTTKRRRQRSSVDAQSEANVAKVAKVLELLMKERNLNLQEQNINSDTFDERKKADELLFILAKFLRIILERTKSSDKAVDDMIEKAAWDMGVSGIKMGDPLIEA